MKPASFFREYRKLNKAQKEAVRTVEGPVMVVAGPGTGKTQILTLRIANILQKTDTPPDAILALTFTEAAATNMRRRLVSLIGSTGYYVNIFTFHGFANHLITHHPDHFSEILGFNNATAIDQMSIVRTLLGKNRFQLLKPFGNEFYHAPKILSAIKHLKREGISAGEFRRQTEEKKNLLEKDNDAYHVRGAYAGQMKARHKQDQKRIEKSIELARMYDLYQKEIKVRKLYDFEDMLLVAIKALEEDKDFLFEAQETYQYVLVDEHQDTNGAQNRILELLSSFFPNPNLFVVGDEKQAIFRFQGASIDNFRYFKDKFQDVRLITLEANYRSSQAILDSAASLIEKNTMLFPARLTAAKRSRGEKFRIGTFNTDDEELLFVTERTKRLIENGTPASEIAVLYRENKDAFPVAEVFERFGVPYAIGSDQDILSDMEIQKLNLLFECIGEFGNDEKLLKALYIDFLGVDPLDAYALTDESRRRRRSVCEVLEFPERGGRVAESRRLKDVYQKMKNWKKESENRHFTDFFEHLLKDSGHLDFLVGLPDALTKLNKVNTLFDEMKKIEEYRKDFSLSDYLEYLFIMREHGVMLAEKTQEAGESVRLLTAHRAKGLEFDNVFIVGAYDGHWGNKRSVEHFALPVRTRGGASSGEGSSDAFEKNEDERRLFYMAITRARKRITASYARYTRDGKERLPCQFIEEIQGKHKKENRMAKPGSKKAGGGMLRYTRRKRHTSIKNPDFFKELFHRQGLSVTALNNYLACPWRYFYRNLMRIPFAGTVPQSYGNAMHRTLKDFFDERAASKNADEKHLMRTFAIYLAREPISEEDLDALREKGSKTLGAYYDFYGKRWNYNTVNEYRIHGIEFADNVRLTGVLDKVELESTAGDVVVVDYKTRTPKSRNWILGKTKDSKGDYIRQLIFYKILLDLLPRKRFTMVAGEIDFLEPNERGIFKKERFEITENDTKELQETIRRVAEEIMALSFWGGGCWEKQCEYCALRAMME